jgi:hypothetical protein
LTDTDQQTDRQTGRQAGRQLQNDRMAGRMDGWMDGWIGTNREVDEVRHQHTRTIYEWLIKLLEVQIQQKSYFYNIHFHVKSTDSNRMDASTQSAINCL